MVYVRQCFDYDRENILNIMRGIMEQSGVLEDIKGLTVAVKPNLIARKKPESAATTHPSIVWAVCRLCREAGAERVIIAESPGGPYEAPLLKSWYRICGMEEAAKDSGAELNFDTSVTEVQNPDAKYLKKLNVITPLAKADRIINIAKLKTHGMMTYTGAVKNMFGAIAGLEKAAYHLQLSDYDDFADCIIDIFHAVKPCFNIIDAVVGMHRDGPTAGDPYPLNTILAGKDAFELDMAGAELIKADPMRIPIFRRAIARGLVSGDLKDRDPEDRFSGDALVPADKFIIKYNDSLKRLHFADGIWGRMLSRAVKPGPVFNKKKCRACGECVKCCPAGVIKLTEHKNGKCAVVNLDGCIRCYCCQELCMFKAVSIKRPLLNKIVVRKTK